MEPHFPEQSNARLMNVMTIARMDQNPANDAALLQELMEGPVMLLVPAEPPSTDRADARGSVTFTHVFDVKGERTLLAFTSEAAIHTFATEDLTCMGIPASDLLRACMGGIDVILLDPKTANEVRVCLTPDKAA